MATLLVRKLQPEIVERLKKRAKAHGRSVEAEHREILCAALQPEVSGKELFDLLRQRGRFRPISILMPGTSTTAVDRPISEPRQASFSIPTWSRPEARAA